MAGIALSTGDRLVAALEDTPVGPRWRAEAPGGGASEVLLVEPLRDDLPREQAARLLEASAALQHPQLRPARRVGLEGARAVWAYDPADGVSLARWLAREAPRGVASLPRARELFDQVCQAIAVVHRGDALAHGGIATWSVHVAPRGAQVVARVDAVGAALLAPPLGVDRVAPEVDPRAFSVSARADVFALGMLLGAILLGEELPAARVAGRLDECREDLDDTLRALVRACLAGDPGARPADASRVRDLVRRAVWTARATPPPRPPPRSPEPAPFERAPPPRPPEPATDAPAPPAPPAPPARPAPPPASPPPPALDDPTDAVRAPPPSPLPEDTDHTAFVTSLPAPDEPAPAYAATLRTPRRAPPEERTRAVAAPPPDAPTEHTRLVLAPPPDAPAVAPPLPAAAPLPDEDLWGGARSSFHLISAPPPAPSWSPPPAAPPTPPPPLAPLPRPPARAAAGPASLIITALVAVVFLAAMLVALTR